MVIDEFLKIAIERDASDLHFKAGNNPMIRIHGTLTPLTGYPRMAAADCEELANQMMTEAQRKRLADDHEIDMAYSIPGLGRFRCNVFHQRGAVGMVLRVIPTQIKSIRPEPADGPGKDRPGKARPGPGHRDDRQRQVDVPGRHDRLHQHPPHRAHRHHRRPHRVPAPRQEEHHQPARGRLRHQRFRQGPAQRPAPGPGRDPGRRNARPGDHRDGPAGRRNRPPGPVHPAHPGRPGNASTASSPCSRPTTRSRSASSWPRCSRPSSP